MLNVLFTVHGCEDAKICRPSSAYMVQVGQGYADHPAALQNNHNPCQVRLQDISSEEEPFKVSLPCSKACYSPTVHLGEPPQALTSPFATSGQIFTPYASYNPCFH